MKILKFRKSSDKKSYSCTISNLSLYQLRVLRSLFNQVYDNGIIVKRSHGKTLPYLCLEFDVPLVAGVPHSFTIPLIELNDLFGGCLPSRNLTIHSNGLPF